MGKAWPLCEVLFIASDLDTMVKGCAHFGMRNENFNHGLIGYQVVSYTPIITFGNLCAISNLTS